MQEKLHQVTIAGGGLVGCVIAYALAQIGIPVLILERLSVDEMLQGGFDGRASAISQGSAQILREFNLWAQLEPLAQPIFDILISDNHQPWFVHFNHTAVGGQPMGYIIENTLLRKHLVQACRDHPLIHWHQGTITALTTSQSQVSITTQNAASFSSQVLIAADGRHSPLRELANIAIVRWSYAQKAIVTSVTHELPHNNTAHEYFFPTGPLALLPMTGDNRSSVVWSDTPETIDRLSKATEADFITALTHRFGNRLGELTLAAPRWSYPLSASFARSYVGPRIALVGDAAHAIHPVAGQGLNLGIRDAGVLVHELQLAWQNGLDLGRASTLRSYEKQRFWDNMAMIMATDQCIRLFGINRLGFPYIRGAAMGLLHRVPFLKRLMIKNAMG
jgi:2-octaprenyl-6-methoxyphenol hydroxylase